jgi:hypothetical protein
MRRASSFIAAVLLLVALVGCSNSNSNHKAHMAASATRVHTTAVACSKVGTKKLAKTRFLLHAGLGIGAFRHFVYTPFRAGKFNKGQKGRVKAMVIAGAAALFTLHQLKTAKGFAESDKTLCKLVAPIDKLTASLPGLGSGLKSGKLDSSGISTTATNVASLKGSSTKLGAPITEHVPPSIPGS